MIRYTSVIDCEVISGIHGRCAEQSQGGYRVRYRGWIKIKSSMATANAPERLRKQLDLDRLFRLERQRPLDRHPLDLTHLKPGI